MGHLVKLLDSIVTGANQQPQVIDQSKQTELIDGLQAVSKLKNFTLLASDEKLLQVLSLLARSPFLTLFGEAACQDVGVLEDMADIGERISPLLETGSDLQLRAKELDLALDAVTTIKQKIVSVLTDHEAKTLGPKINAICQVFKQTTVAEYWKAFRVQKALTAPRLLLSGHLGFALGGTSAHARSRRTPFHWATTRRGKVEAPGCQASRDRQRPPAFSQFPSPF